jgi:signal transduction histidine kinase
MLARESQPSREETAHAWPLKSVIPEILDAREEDLKHKALAVELRANGHPEVRAPRAVLIVVFGNLLGNAIAYTGNGGIRITLDEQGATVEDTGAGIAEKDEAHIFRRAYRGRESRAQGSGLGLAIVHRLCQRYGWRIGFDSTQGQGTRIWLAFSP